MNESLSGLSGTDYEDNKQELTKNCDERFVILLKKVDPIMFRGWTCDTWLGKPLGGTLGKWIMVVIFQIGHSQNKVQKNLTNSS